MHRHLDIAVRIVFSFLCSHQLSTGIDLCGHVTSTLSLSFELKVKMLVNIKSNSYRIALGLNRGVLLRLVFCLSKRYEFTCSLSLNDSPSYFRTERNHSTC